MASGVAGTVSRDIRTVILCNYKITTRSHVVTGNYALQEQEPVVAGTI